MAQKSRTQRAPDRRRRLARHGRRRSRPTRARRGSCASAASTASISRWDASGLFGELGAQPRRRHDASPRTLSLVYAADLAFRLRWEIRPVLEAGGVVIAAPYVETAIAFGGGCGLPEQWLRELLRFAPAGRPARPGRTSASSTDRGSGGSIAAYPEYRRDDARALVAAQAASKRRAARHDRGARTGARAQDLHAARRQRRRRPSRRRSTGRPAGRVAPVVLRDLAPHVSNARVRKRQHRVAIGRVARRSSTASACLPASRR